MSSANDTFSISSLLESHSSYQPTFKSRNLTYVESTQSVGINQRFEFFMASKKNVFCDFSKAFLRLPEVVTPSGISKALAIKGSDASLIFGIKVSDGNTVIYEDENLQYSSLIRSMFEKNRQWVADHASTVSFALDGGSVGRGLISTASVQHPSITRSLPPGLTGASAYTNLDNPNYNKGFEQRCVYLQDKVALADQSLTPAGSVSMEVNIPLAFLSDFFAKMDKLQYGKEYKIEFRLNSQLYTSFTPFCLGSSGALVVPVPCANTPDVAGATVTCGVTVGQIPRLYYHECLMDPTETERFLGKYNGSGIYSDDTFKKYEVINNTYLGLTDGSAVNHYISPSSVNPKRVFVVATPAGLVNGATWPGVLVSAGGSGLTNVDVYVAGQRTTNTPIITPAEQFELFKRCCSTSEDDESVGLVSFSDFCRTSRILCLDLTRLRGVIVDPLMPLSIQITGKVVAPYGAVDLTYIIERECRCISEMKSGMQSKYTTSI